MKFAEGEFSGIIPFGNDPHNGLFLTRHRKRPDFPGQYHEQDIKDAGPSQDDLHLFLGP
jgi:hypothetical protein